MRSHRLCVLVIAAAALAALGLDGCSGIGSIGPSGNSTSQVRAVNGLQGCPAIDIEQLNVAPVQFPNVQAGVAPGAYTSVRSGLGLHYGVFQMGSMANPLALADVDLQPHDAAGNANTGTYTLVATGTCSGAVGSTAPQLVRLVDAFPFNFTGSAANTVAIRVINLVPDVGGGITLDINGASIHGTDDLGTNSVAYAGTANLDNSHYNEVSAIPSGATLTIRSSSNTVLATAPSFSFLPNHAYTLFVIGEVHPSAG